MLKRLIHAANTRTAQMQILFFCSVDTRTTPNWDIRGEKKQDKNMQRGKIFYLKLFELEEWIRV